MTHPDASQPWWASNVQHKAIFENTHPGHADWDTESRIDLRLLWVSADTFINYLGADRTGIGRCCVLLTPLSFLFLVQWGLMEDM